MALKDFLTIHLPYCIEHVTEGKFVVLNREYKPLGCTDGRTRLDYERYAVTLKGLTPEVAARVSWDGKSDISRIWLYADHCMPTKRPSYMKEYLDRLAILAKLKVPQKEVNDFNSGLGNPIGIFQ